MNKNQITADQFNFKAALEKRGAQVDEKQEVFLDAIREVLIANESKESDEEKSAKISAIVEAQIKNLRADDELAAQFRSLAKDVSKIKDLRVNVIPDTEKQQLRSFINENHAKIVDAVRGKKDFNFEIRTAAPHYNDNGTIAWGAGQSFPVVENVELNGGICTLRLPENFLLNIIRNLNVGALGNLPHSVVKTEQAAKEGDAALVAEHNSKPLVQYKWVKNVISRKKYAGHIIWSEEFEADNNALFMAIIQMIENDVIRAWNNGMWTAITTNATAYTGGGSYTGIIPFGSGTVAEAAMVLQNIIQTQNYQPDTVVINPIDLIGVLLRMKADGTYIPNPFFVDGKLNGMSVLVTNVIVAGYVLVFDSSIYSERHTDYISRTGTINAQLITNEWTLVAEIFSILEVCEINLVASMYDSISTILSDIEEAEAEG